MSDCKRVIFNTLVIAVAKLFLNIIVPLAFALLLNEIRQVKFKKALQTIVYLPHFLSPDSKYTKDGIDNTFIAEHFQQNTCQNNPGKKVRQINNGLAVFL